MKTAVVVSLASLLALGLGTGVTHGASDRENLQVAQSSPKCGGAYPVILEQTAGFFVYRWCASSTANYANRDVYTNQSGRLNYHYSNLVSCGDPAMPGQVSDEVCS